MDYLYPVSVDNYDFYSKYKTNWYLKHSHHTFGTLSLFLEINYRCKEKRLRDEKENKSR